MLKQSDAKARKATSAARTIDLIVVVTAGVFFTNIVLGGADRDEPMLFLAADMAPVVADGFR